MNRSFREINDPVAGTRRLPLARMIFVFLAALALAATCFRYAWVAAEAEQKAELAAAIWPGHPDVLRQQVMLAVAQAARQRSALAPVAADRIRLLSERAPLAAEPFAIRGAGAMREGRYDDAERLLGDARRRDPREAGVRYLLSEVYLRQQKVVPALQELIVLAQLSPEATPLVTAALASYAHVPGAISKLQLALRNRPDIKNALLAKLAEDPKNVRLILALAPSDRADADLANWEKVLMSSLVGAGRVKTAFALWQQFTGLHSSDVGDFSDSAIDSPFTWRLITTSEGAATSEGRRLDTQFFGQADTVLATKVLLMAPGEYELRFRVTDSTRDPGSVHLTLTCLPMAKENLDLEVQPGLSAVRFEMPPNCEAERIELKGLAQVYPAEVSFSISDMQVRRLP